MLAGWPPSGTRPSWSCRSPGDRGGAALGDRLLGVVDAVQDGADLGEELGEVDLADPGHRGQQPSLGLAPETQAGTQGAVQVGDGANQGAKQPDLSSDQLGQRLWRQAKWWGGAERSRTSSSAGLRPPR